MQEKHTTMANQDAINQKAWSQSEYQAKSEFTLLIYFRQGYTKGMKFHSFKQEKRRVGGFEIRDLRYALNRLTYLVEDRFKEKYKTALLYHNPTGIIIIQWAYDRLKSKEPYKWRYSTNGDVLFDLMRNPENDLQKIMVAQRDNFKY